MRSLPEISLSDLLDMSGHGQDLFMLEATLGHLEVEAATTNDPQSLYGLALFYQLLRVELPDASKEQIERAKLRAQGREFVMDMPMNTKVISNILGKNASWDLRFAAAATYCEKANILSYQSMNNVGRSVMNFMEAKSLDTATAHNPLKINFLAIALLDHRYANVLDLLH